MRLALIFLGGFLVLAGCQHFERAEQCRALADGVNPELKELSAVYAKRNPASAEEYHDASKKYAAAAARMRSLKFKEPELTRLAQDLGENLVAIGRSCDRLASTFKYPVTPAQAAAERDLQAQREHHSSTVGAIDRFCQD